LLVFMVVMAGFSVVRLAAEGQVDLGRWLPPCGFKQRYGLPCPTCGMTTAAMLFVKGKLFEAFYVQPAGAVLCTLAAVAAILALLVAVSGLYFDVSGCIGSWISLKYVLLLLGVVIACGWAVTLARTLAGRVQP